MITTTVTIEARCDRCEATVTRRLRDGTARQLIAATRRRLVHRDAWLLARRWLWFGDKYDLCPACAIAPQIIPPPMNALDAGR